MMENEILSSNTIIAQTLSPLHIGTGKKLGAFEYVSENGSIIVIDEDKLLNWISEDQSGRLASEFEGLVARNINPEQTQKGYINLRIGDFLNQHHVNPSTLAAYSLHDSTQSQPRDINPFIKNARNEPYVPGSSLKGSLRSRLLRGITLEDEKRRQDYSGMVQREAEARGKSAGKEVEANVFVKAGVSASQYSNYDLNRVLVIRDSRTLKIGDLEVVEVKTLSARGDQLDFKSYSIYVEALRVSPKDHPILLHFPATWQTYLLQETGAASQLELSNRRRLMLFLPEFCRAVSFELFDQEINFFRQMHHRQLAGWYEEKRDDLKKRQEELFFLPLGWGTGYDAKTITDLLDIKAFRAVADNCENTQGLGRPGNTRGAQWLGAALSPKSRKVVVGPDGKLEPLGWLAVIFRPVGEPESDWLTIERANFNSEKPVIEVKVNVQSKQDLKGEVQTQIQQPPQVELHPIGPAEPKEAPPISKFRVLPVVGQRFYGEPIDVTKNSIFLRIPIKSSNFRAIAVLELADNPDLDEVQGQNSILCRVLRVEEEKNNPGQWLVFCKVE